MVESEIIAAPEPPTSPPSLDNVFISLQKTLSRVSNLSAKVGKEDARALITGDVNFSIELRVDNVDDCLQLHRDGQIKLTMSGVISTDIRAEALQSDTEQVKEGDK